MRRTILLTALALVLVPVLAGAQVNPYRWTLSSSATDPLANVGTGPTGGILNLYLWLDCPLLLDGVAAAEFDVAVPAGSVALAITPTPGILNAATLPNVLLAMPCQTSTALLATILVSDTGSGDYCLVTSSTNGKNVSVDCTNFLEWNNEVVGYNNAGGFPCDTTNLCMGLSVEPETWGSVKTLYR